MSNERDWELPIETAKDGLQRNIARRDYALVGQSFRLIMDHGETYELALTDEASARWEKIGERPLQVAYLCMRANETAWMVTFMESETTNVTVVLDKLNGLVTILRSTLGAYPARPKLTAQTADFGFIDTPGVEPAARRHFFSADLVGKKIAWHYSPVVTITHIYSSAHSIRSSLNDMKPLPENATPEQRRECENRAERWGRVFFEEPCTYIRIQDHLYLVTFREENRNRVDPSQGGGDLLVLVDTQRLHDVGRTFGQGPEGKPRFNLLTASGELVHSPDPMDTAPSPYWI